MGLKKQAHKTEDKLCETIKSEAASKEATMLEAKQQAIKEFKQSEEYQASQDYDTEYNKGVEESFYNIWRKCQEVNYKFLGKEYQLLIVDWKEQEKSGELDTRPPLSPEYSENDCEIVWDKEPAENTNNSAADA